MKAVAVKVGQPAVVMEIPNELEPLQKFVGGYIEAVGLRDGCTVICNEEGCIYNLPNNREVPIYGMIKGDFLICEVDSGGEFRSVSKKNQQKYLEMFS